MHNSPITNGIIAVGIILVLAIIAYIALYYKHDGAKIGLMKPAKVFGYIMLLIVPYILFFCIITYSN